MQAALIPLVTLLAYGFIALLGTAVLVAWWEHLRRAAAPPTVPLPAPQRATHVDLDLSALETAWADGDQRERQAAVADAISRATRQPVSDVPAGWTETRPMVAPSIGTQAEPH